MKGKKVWFKRRIVSRYGIRKPKPKPEFKNACTRDLAFLQKRKAVLVVGFVVLAYYIPYAWACLDSQATAGYFRKSRPYKIQ